MASKFFTGEHSTVLINFDNVEYAESEGPSGGDITIHFRSGKEIVLSHGNADMFRKQWRNVHGE
jgi:hypothetical protein